MEELFEKLSFLRKKWVKRSLAIVMCIAVTFATMPTSASTAVEYNARVLRDYRVTGVEDIALQETKLVENEAETEQEISLVEAVVIEETTAKSEGEETLVSAESSAAENTVSDTITEVTETQIKDLSEEAVKESETNETKTEIITEESEINQTEEKTIEEETVAKGESLTEEKTTEGETTEEETLTEEEIETKEETIIEKETLIEGETTTEEETLTEEETTTEEESLTEEETTTEEETLTEEETTEEETLTEEETTEEETLTEEETTEEETTEEETLTEEETTEETDEREAVEVSVVIEGVSDESKDEVSIQFKSTEDDSVVTCDDNGTYTLVIGQEYEILLEGLKNCKVVSVNGEKIEEQKFIYSGEDTLTIEVKRSFMMFLMNLSQPDPVNVTVTIDGIQNIDLTQVSLEFTNTETDEIVTKNDDDTYTLQPGATYKITKIEGLDDYQLLEINGTTVNGECSFTFDGETELILTFLNMVMKLTTQIDVTVSGPSDGNFSGLVDNVEFSLKDSNENTVDFKTSGGSAQIELEEGKNYTLNYSPVQGYYISNFNGTFVAAGDEISFINDGTITAITITFSAAPKMYSLSNGDYSLDVNKVYELYTYHNIVTGGDVAYNDGGLHTLYFNSSDKLMSFVESAENADENYLVLGSGAQIGLNLTNESSQYMMKAIYSASTDGRSANITFGTYGGSLSTVGTASSTKINSQTYRKLLSAGSNYAIGGTGSVAIHDVILYQVENKTLTGTLNNNGTTIPAGISITYKNTEYGITKTATVNTDGSYEITLPTTTEGITYDVTLDAGTTGVQMMETTNSVTVSRSSANAGEFDVESSGEVTFTFSSSDAGFANVEADITAVYVTLNRTTTTIESDASGTYKAALTAGKTYSFEVEGIPAYEVTSIVVDGNTTTGNSYTYTGAETQIELVFSAKSVHKVYFDILAEDQAILDAKGIDFSDGTYIFTFTDRNNVARPAVKKDTSGSTARYYVELCEGTYSVELSGEGIDKLPYQMTANKVDVTEVDESIGEENTFYFDMEAITKWNFTTANGFTQKYEGNEGYWKGLFLDAKTNSGAKIQVNQDIQAIMNPGTIVSIPVSGPSTITIDAYNADAVYVGYITLAEGQTNAELSCEGTDAIIKYTGSAGYVSFTTTKQTYFYSIEVKDGVSSVDITTWYFNGKEAKEDYEASFSGSISGKSTWMGLTIDTSNGGKFESRSNDVQVGANTTIAVPVKGQCNISITAHNSTYASRIVSDDYTLDYNDKVASLEYSGGEGNVTLKISGGETYIWSIIVTYPSTETYTKWYFNSTPTTKEGEATFTSSDAIQNTSKIWKGLKVDATTGKLALNGENGTETEMGATTIVEIPVSGTCRIKLDFYNVSAAKAIVVQGEGTINTISVERSNNSDLVYINYTGSEATYIEITTNEKIYIEVIEIEGSSDTPDVTEDNELPRIAKDGELFGSSYSTMLETITGQRITITQSGGPEFLGIVSKGDSSFTNMGYYIFEKTTNYDVLEFDMKITEMPSSNAQGVFPGIFSTENMYTVGFRGKNGAIQRTYSDSFYAKTSSEGASAYAVGERFHIRIEKTSANECVINFNSYDDDTHVGTYTTKIADAQGTEMYFGICLSSAAVELTNILYTTRINPVEDADGIITYTETVTYNQNDIYEPVGTAPTARALYATAAELNGAIVVELSILGETPAEDGFYVIKRVETTSGEEVTIVDELYGTTFTDDTLPAGEEGTYIYKVYGQLGRPSKGGSVVTATVSSKSVKVNGALNRPEVTAIGDETGITLTWTCDSPADYFTIYRYSYDDGYSARTIIRKKETSIISADGQTSSGTYKDTVAGGLKLDDPYYYIVQAVVESPTYNESLITEEAAVWAVPESNRTGYEYEDVEIVITNRSYQTVYTNKILLEGLVDGSSGTVAAYIGGSKKDEVTVGNREEFSFELTIAQGRNEVDLVFTAADGTQAKKSFNYIYVTDFDAIVDASYTGTDGDASTIVSGASIPTYKTITAALDAAPSSSSGRHIILILEGDYEERILVSKPNITLLGEEPERTIIHYYPGILGSDYEAGGHMDKRCATYIMNTATNFSAENLTFKNDYNYATNDGKNNKSADAVRSDADGTTFINCILTGVQDTLYLNEGQQYFYRCQINGAIDYIYCGDEAKVFFNECILNYVLTSKNNGYIVAPRTSPSNEFGLVFYKCAIVSEEGCSGDKYMLGRPWGPDGMAVWINCFMGKVLNDTLPYSDMSENAKEDARFFEYYSYGPSNLINSDRRQISYKHANKLISAGMKGYFDTFIGSLKVDRDMLYLEEVFESDTYAWGTSDNEDAMADFFLEGYGESYGISGGGLLKETSDNYYQVGTAEEFLQALSTINSKKAASVIELTADIALGSKELGGLMTTYSSIIKPYANQPLTHPTLKQTGVSVLTLNKLSNITIFSHNGFTIKHANMHIKQCTNIMIRNIRFDELWEWDEATNGAYDRNDWDYMTIEKSDGIWIDHCSFYKAYDGIVDIKNPNPTSNVTISWCNFFPGSKDGTFLQAMMDYVRANPSEFPTTYQVMLASGMTEDQIDAYAYAQKKTSLFGQGDKDTNAKGIKVTMANNYFAQSMDRLPRLRYGTAHIYNTIMDSQNTLDAKDSVTDSAMKSKFVSNGASSTCGAQMLLENTLIQGIMNPLNSGNGSSPAGYINAINSAYYMYKARATLEVKNNTSADDQVLVTNATSFRQGLPYTYSLKNAINLYSTVQPYSGAGKVTMTTLQWEQASYNTTKKASESSSVTDAPESSEDIPDVKDYEDIKDAEANAGLEEELPEEELVPEEEIQQEESDDSGNADNAENEPVKKEEPEEEKPVAKLGDTILVNGKAYIVASISGDIAYRVSSALPEDVLTEEVRRATGTNTIVDLINFLKNDLANTTAMQVNQMVMRETDSMQVVDISVVIRQANGEWVEVTKETFPSSGLNVIIPYPSRTSRTTHRFAVSHLIVLGCNGKIPGTIEYLTPTCMDEGLQVHIMDASPFTVAWELLVVPTTETKAEETAGSKWISAMKANSSVSAEEDAESRARNGSMSTRFTIDSVMGSGYLLWVSFVSIAIMGSGNYLYYRKKRKEELEEEAEHVIA